MPIQTEVWNEHSRYGAANATDDLFCAYLRTCLAANLHHAKIYRIVYLLKWYVQLGKTKCEFCRGWVSVNFTENV